MNGIIRTTLLHAFNNQSEGNEHGKGLGSNSKKTEVPVTAVGRNNECPQIIFINKNMLKQRDQVIYLGTIIPGDGRKNTEIASRIARTKKSFQRMKSILTKNHISVQTRRTLECFIERILMCGCVAWTISKQVGCRNVVLSENVTNLMECKEIKLNSVTRSRHNNVTHK